MLTDSQLTTLGNHIRANPDVAAALAAGNLGDIRDAYNAPTIDPVVWVFNAQVNVDDTVESLDWAGEYALFKDDLPAIRLLFDNGTYAVEGPGARAALNAVFANCPNTKTAILAAATRPATLAESLFVETATGPGGGDGTLQTAAATAVVAGAVTTQEIDLALERTAP
jgi:hypothetical protein